MADSTADKARKARNRARETTKYAGGTTYDTERLVRKNSRGGKDITLGDKIGGLYLTKAEERAAKLMQTRRINDTGRTAARATFITGPNSPVSKARKEAATVKANTGVSKKQAPKSVTNKATEKMKSTPKVKITGTASSKPQVSGSMSKSQPKTTTKPKATSLTKKAGKK
jgi:hypothetical protein